MLLPGILSVYVLFVTTSSFLLEKASHPVLLIAAAVLFLAIIFAETKYPRVRSSQILFLGFFHYFSHLSWCLPIYLILTANEYRTTQNLKRSLLIAICYYLVYSGVRLTFVPFSSYAVLVSVADLFSFLVVVYVIFLFLQVQKERLMLIQETERLITHDSLTGLINFTEFHKRLGVLTRGKRPFALFFLDCHDLKSINYEQGYSGGNQFLVQLANTLEAVFPTALLIGRCGGDDFALVVELDSEERPLDHYKQLLDEELPYRLGWPVIYGEAVFPDAGQTKDELISAAERKLYLVKRENWLKQEENMLRAEKLRVVGELAAGMAHEIRNPMTTVKGFLQIAKERNFNIQPYYELLMDEVNRVSELTSELLQFSKPHAGDIRVLLLQESIQRAISLAESEALFYGHELHQELPAEPLYIRMDKDKLVQVLLNLIKNAFEAMQQSGVVTIRLAKVEENGIIEIRDTGGGIPEAELRQIFNPFFTTKETGTGLGLSICHKIITDHGGGIEVESVDGKGTTFRIILPLVAHQE